MTGDSNIDIPSDENCAFCAYLRGDRPYTILSRERLVAILVTREQRGVSHLLVVPTRHCQTILDLADDESAAIMNAIRSAARAIDLAYRRPGIAIWQNNGIPAHQTIGHLHFHVAGTLVPELSLAETEAIAEKLRRADAS